jgi:glycosyltransferase involved in cell wall biosynthesis
MRILLVSYHLYPDGSAEGLCVAKTARALCDAGHDLTVVTANRRQGEESDSAAGVLLSGIPVVEVPPDPSSVPRWCRRMAPFTRPDAGGGLLARGAAAATRLALGCSPDAYSWVQPLSRRIIAVNNHATPPFDAIHSRLNHSISHLAVLAALPALAPRPAWCAHFSDPWPHHLYPEDYRTPVGWLSRPRLEGTLERILDGAGSLTFPGDRLMRLMLSGRRQKYRTKAHVVPHLGNYWMRAVAGGSHDRFTILFAGNLLQQRNPTSFFLGLRGLLDGEPGARESTQIQFVGPAAAWTEKLARRYEVQDVVVTLPRQPFEVTWGLICQSDLLLLIESSMEEGIFLPSKFADYVSAQRPILALSPPNGTVADLLSKGGGLRVDPDKPDRIAEALIRLYRLWRAGRLEELKPPSSLTSYVSPSFVVPAYEAAFRQAMGPDPAHTPSL